MFKMSITKTLGSYLLLKRAPMAYFIAQVYAKISENLIEIQWHFSLT